jgi:hypothetical protein
MWFRFKFLLANGKVEYHGFHANQYADAAKNAFDYCRLAYRRLEVLDFYYCP